MSDKVRGILERFYDRNASAFWDPLRGPVGRDKVVYPLIEKMGGNFLEYGCGSCSFLFHVAKSPKFHRVIGVDLSAQVIRNAESAIAAVNDEWARKVKFAQPTRDLLPAVADESIDVIASLATIEHVLDPYLVLDELWRIGREGGFLVCSVPNYAYIKHRVNLLLGKLPRTGSDLPVERWRECGWDGMHLHAFTKGAFGSLLRACGWEPVHWTGWGDKLQSLSYFRKRFPSVFSGELVALAVKRPKRSRTS